MSPILKPYDIKTGFWGQPTATLDWCERNYEVKSLVFYQRSIRPILQSVTFDIVSRCFENKKNNNCCETNICKNAICLLFTNLQSIIWQPCCQDVQAAELSEMDL